MKVTPLAAESLGARSMCTLVETPDTTILLDAGVSLAPYRFSMLPHPKEFQNIDTLRQEIAKAADKARIVTISHYHFDHHTPSYEDWLVNWTQATETARQIYQGKTVFLKHPKENINASQRQRAWMFQKTAGKYALKLKVADGKELTFGETVLRFSEAVSHGPEDSELGWVIMTTVEHNGERFMHAPDVQGPISDRTTQLILTQKPSVLMIGGPPFYLAGYKTSELQLKRAVNNLTTIVSQVPTVIVEHHALRGEEREKNLEPILQAAKKARHNLLTAAEFIGEENKFLESERKQLYEKFSPGKDFEAWTRLPSEQLSHVKPPIEM